MGESRQPERIEIELTSNRVAHGWERPSDAADDSQSAGDHPGSVVVHSVGIDQRRIWGTVAIAVAALALGWLLGRSGGSNDESSVDTSATTSLATSTTQQVDDVIAGVEPVVTVPPAAPVVVPETAPRAFYETTVEQVKVHESVAGLPIEIVALGSGRRVISLDLETGALDTRVIDSQPFGPPTLFVGEGWLLLPSWDDDLASTLIPDDAAPESVELGPAWRLLTAPESGVIWRADAELFSDVIGVAEQIGLDGARLGVSVELPSAPLVADPAGGLVVQVPGGVFQVEPEGATRITPGRLVAIGADHALSHECDDQLICDYGIVDRATGMRSALLLGEALGEQPFLGTTWTPTSGSAFSPDGASVAVEWIGTVNGFRAALVVLDLETGAVTEVAATIGAVPYAWSPDGRVLFYVHGGSLKALDIDTGEANSVVRGLVAVETFALRPLSAAG